MPSQDNGHGAIDDLIVAHTSDLHIGGGRRGASQLHLLEAVIAATNATRADVLILAGDIFDNNRVPPAMIDDAAAVLDRSEGHVVVLPGNHDPATADAVYHAPAFGQLHRVSVLGIGTGDLVRFSDLELDVWGAPHTDYADMAPLAAAPARTMRRHIVVAHGHWVRDERDEHRSWLIHDHEITATGADYVALGHWDVPQPAGDGTLPAFYSGSPEFAQTINIVRFAGGAVDVRRHPLAIYG